MDPKDFPLPIEGMSHLKDEKPSEEKKPEAETKPQEEVLTLEELKARFPNLKVKYTVAGEEVVEELASPITYKQRFSGLERTAEKKSQELTRLLDEQKRQIADIQAKLAEKPKETAEPEDPDDPGVFVDGRVKSALEPVQESLRQLQASIAVLADGIKPQLGARNLEKAKELLKKNGVPHDDLDSMTDKMVEFFQEKAGRDLNSDEIAQISPSNWSFAYLALKTKGVNGEKKPEKQPEKTVETGTLEVKRQEKQAQFLSRETGPVVEKKPEGIMVDASVKKLVEEGDWAGVLLKRGVRPMQSQKGE